MRQGAGITQRREVIMTEQIYSASAEGNLYKDKNDLISAEKYYNFALDLKPDMLQVYKNLFFIFYKSNQFKKLKEILIKAKNNLGYISFGYFTITPIGIEKIPSN